MINKSKATKEFKEWNRLRQLKKEIFYFDVFMREIRKDCSPGELSMNIFTSLPLVIQNKLNDEKDNLETHYQKLISLTTKKELDLISNFIVVSKYPNMQLYYYMLDFSSFLSKYVMHKLRDIEEKAIFYKIFDFETYEEFVELKNYYNLKEIYYINSLHHIFLPFLYDSHFRVKNLTLTQLIIKDVLDIIGYKNVKELSKILKFMSNKDSNVDYKYRELIISNVEQFIMQQELENTIIKEVGEKEGIFKI